MASMLSAINDLLFPPHCLGCERRLETSRPPLFCSDCAADLAFIRSPLCPCCGLPYAAGADHLCGDCLGGPQPFDRACSLLHYRPPFSDLLLALKFNGNLAGIATASALLERAHVLDTLTPPDMVLPVPLHVTRLRERGFNQALVIARGCLERWRDRIVPDLLLRPRLTTPQSLLSGKERRHNLRNAFGLADPVRVLEKDILLVDDVFTTGSTVSECAKVLRKAGARRIEILTLARSLGG